MKWAVNEQDQQDFEQEEEIRKWLERERANIEFEYQYRTGKGTARNTLLRASISLDQKVSEDGSSTFADIIAGCDGRNLECGGNAVESGAAPEEQISWALLSLGLTEDYLCLLNQELLEVKMKLCPKTLRLNRLRMNLQAKRLLLEKSQTDSEWLKQLRHFEE